MAENTEAGAVGPVNRFWISWFHDPEGPSFEIHSPWWRSGVALMNDDTERHTICAAILADSEEDAKARVLRAYDSPPKLSWRFCSQRASDWSPFGDRFGRADWMVWPVAEATAAPQESPAPASNTTPADSIGHKAVPTGSRS